MNVLDAVQIELRLLHSDKMQDSIVYNELLT